ncbi:MAG: NAD(P)-dependent glycerol-3-phosphate dehydrogenase [Sedimentisphaerales bacterium]|nr:NAD(P)-dependent glycerol-3-phosphate dehydrogenase [Sedimentisphaerales bacterium]
MTERIAIVGDGAMGTVCGLILTGKGYRVRMWSYDAEQAWQIDHYRENRRFLPGFILPAALEVTADDELIFQDVGWVVSAVPCKYLRNVWKRLAKQLPDAKQKRPCFISVTKGIEHGTFARPTEVMREVLDARPYTALSGPNIAEELARKLPATTTVASEDENLLQRVQQLFSTAWLRVYTNTDIMGVELAGATKNVIAVAAGVLDGMQVGHNIKAALLTRGMVEISRLGIALGARAETFNGLSGMGDLITTCYSPSGRNRTFGESIGKGMSIRDALEHIPGEVEGVNTVRSLVALARQYHVEMPITAAVYAVIFESKPVMEAIGELMTRKLKAEDPLSQDAYA